jgi:hypothetical protein
MIISRKLAALFSINRRLALALAPGLVMGTMAVAIASAVPDPGVRFVLEILAIGSVAAMSWRVGAAALGGTMTRAHGLPHRLQAVAGDRRPTFDRETGLHAEWYFRLRADEEIARAKRYHQPFSMLLITAETRDTMGAARIAMRQWQREVDFAGDLGKVLALCLPNTDREGAMHASDRLTQVVSDLHVAIAEYPNDGSTLADLLHEDQRVHGLRVAS